MHKTYSFINQTYRSIKHIHSLIKHISMYQNPISNKIQINNPKAKKQQAYISLKTVKELTQINK